MSPRRIRTWSWLHTWSSLVCTVFLLMLCLTGLPLVFHDEIDDALNPDRWEPAHPGAARLDLDQLLANALAARPGEVPLFLSFDTDRPVVNVTSGAHPSVSEAAMHFASWDWTSGARVPPANKGEALMHFLLQLHTDLFLGLPGMLFLGAMGLLFAVAVVSGVVLYGPFMRKLDFGTVRTQRSPRVKWLDYHNLLGIVTLAWVLLVALTGVINTLADPIVERWREVALADLVAGRDAEGPPSAPSSLQAAVDAARAAAPGMVLQFVAFPGVSFTTNHHYAVFLHGNTPLTEHLVTPVLVDARDGTLVGVREMPWYAKALSLSKPLHFGDYAGLPLKILWAALTVLTLIVLGSGIYLWGVRRVNAAPPLVSAVAEQAGGRESGTT